MEMMWRWDKLCVLVWKVAIFRQFILFCICENFYCFRRDKQDGEGDGGGSCVWGSWREGGEATRVPVPWKWMGMHIEFLLSWLFIVSLKTRQDGTTTSTTRHTPLPLPSFFSFLYQTPLDFIHSLNCSTISPNPGKDPHTHHHLLTRSFYFYFFHIWILKI